MFTDCQLSSEKPNATLHTSTLLQTVYMDYLLKILTLLCWLFYGGMATA